MKEWGFAFSVVWQEIKTGGKRGVLLVESILVAMPAKRCARERCDVGTHAFDLMASRPAHVRSNANATLEQHRNSADLPSTLLPVTSDVTTLKTPSSSTKLYSDALHEAE
jgi:hypothetical protein